MFDILLLAAPDDKLPAEWGSSDNKQAVSAEVHQPPAVTPQPIPRVRGKRSNLTVLLLLLLYFRMCCSNW